MGQNLFAESLVETMLSWMHWLTSWFWNIINSGGTGGGFWAWFSANWKSLTVSLIVIGVVVDWLIWLIRWRPYWLWLRKRQIIYEEVPVRKKKSSPAVEDEFSEYETAHDVDVPAEDYIDDGEYEASESTENAPSPYAPPTAKAPLPSDAEDDLDEWDSFEDPYAQDTPETDASAEAPTLGASKKVTLNHARPALGERMNFSDVDNG